MSSMPRDGGRQGLCARRGRAGAAAVAAADGKQRAGSQGGGVGEDMAKEGGDDFLGKWFFHLFFLLEVFV